jgi:hypothetical protein
MSFAPDGKFQAPERLSQASILDCLTSAHLACANKLLAEDNNALLKSPLYVIDGWKPAVAMVATSTIQSVLARPSVWKHREVGEHRAAHAGGLGAQP